MIGVSGVRGGAADPGEARCSGCPQLLSSALWVLLALPHLVFTGWVPKTPAAPPQCWGYPLTRIRLSPTVLPMGDTPMDGMVVDLGLLCFAC